jgi:hypothetical protein
MQCGEARHKNKMVDIFPVKNKNQEFYLEK